MEIILRKLSTLRIADPNFPTQQAAAHIQLQLPHKKDKLISDPTIEIFLGNAHNTTHRTPIHLKRTSNNNRAKWPTALSPAADHSEPEKNPAGLPPFSSF